MEEHRIHCPRCRHGNPSENRFCGACGASLTSSGDQIARRWENGPAPVRRALLPEDLKPVGRALALGIAALAAEAGLAWLRRRAEGSDRPSLPVARETEPAIPEEYPVYGSFEEAYAWLREGNIESRIFTQRTVRAFRTTNPTDG